jgi:hypothetical protein
MNRSSAGKWARRAVWGALAAVLAIGCNPLNLAAVMFARDDKLPAPYPLTFAKDGPKKDKEEVVVLVLPHLAPGTSPTFFSAERELSAELSRALPEMAKENKDKRKVRVISPTQVDKFKTANPTWKGMNAGEIGQKLGADFVLEIELANMRLYQPGTGAQVQIYEGRADVAVNVHEVGADDGFKSYALSFSYPRGMARDASAMSESEFKKQYITQLAVEITERHVDHKASNGIAGGR